MTKAQEVEDEEIHDYAQAFLTCRTFGHAWRIVASAQLGESDSFWTFVVKCRTCKTERRDVVTRSGSLGHRTYEYPEGYLRPHHRNDRTEYRLELIHRARPA